MLRLPPLRSTRATCTRAYDTCTKQSVRTESASIATEPGREDGGQSNNTYYAHSNRMRSNRHGVYLFLTRSKVLRTKCVSNVYLSTHRSAATPPGLSLITRIMPQGKAEVCGRLHPKNHIQNPSDLRRASMLEMEHVPRSPRSRAGPTASYSAPRRCAERTSRHQEPIIGPGLAPYLSCPLTLPFLAVS